MPVRVVGAGFALPRDAGLEGAHLVSRSRAMPRTAGSSERALRGRCRSGLSGLVSRSRAMPVGVGETIPLSGEEDQNGSEPTRGRCRIVAPERARRASGGADDPVGGGAFLRPILAPTRRGRKPAPLSAMRGVAGTGSFARCAGDAGQGCRGWFRAPARCRSETGAPILAMRGVAGGVSRAARAMLVRVVGAGFALPRDAGRRPALLSLLCGE